MHVPAETTTLRTFKMRGAGAAVALVALSGLMAMPALAYADDSTDNATSPSALVASVNEGATAEGESSLESLTPIDADPALTFATRLYADVLGRMPDVAGLSTQYNALKNGALPAEIAYNYFNSEEYLDKNEAPRKTVERAYRVMFGENGDEEGIEFWTSYLEAGMSVRAIIQGFSESDQYRAYFASEGLNNETISRTTLEPRDQNLEITQFAQRLYSLVLGRTAEVAGLNCQTEALINQASCADITANFFDSAEFKGFGLDTDTVVETAYQAILGRECESEESLDFWANRIDHGGLTYVGLASGFCQSPEFTALCATYNMNPGTLSDVTRRVDLTGKNVVFLGDSITYGAGLDAAKGEKPYSELFAASYGANCTNLAVPGASFANLPGTLGVAIDQARSVPEDADVVVIMFGTNDYGLSAQLGDSESDDETTIGALYAVVETVRSIAPDAVIIGIIPPRLPGDTVANGAGLTAIKYKQAISDAYDELNITTADFNSVTFAWSAVKGDKTLIHPDATAQKNFGSYLATWYRSAL